MHKTFGIGKDTTANILITISTFLAGIIITLILNAIKAYIERRNNKKLLKINLKNLLKGLFRQAAGYENISKQLTIGHNGSFNFSPKSIAAGGIFIQLGYKNLHSSIFNGIENVRLFNRRKKRIAFNNIWATLEFLSVFHQDSFALTKEFYELNADANEKRNTALGEVQKIIESIRLTLHAETIPTRLGNYFAAIEQIIINLRAQENYMNPKIMNDFFVHPLLDLSRSSVDVIKEFRDIIRPVELNAALLESDIRYTNQKNLFEAYQNNFEGLNDSFLINYERMKNSYRVLF